MLHCWLQRSVILFAVLKVIAKFRAITEVNNQSDTKLVTYCYVISLESLDRISDVSRVRKNLSTRRELKFVCCSYPSITKISRFSTLSISSVLLLSLFSICYYVSYGRFNGKMLSTSEKKLEGAPLSNFKDWELENAVGTSLTFAKIYHWPSLNSGGALEERCVTTQITAA